MEGSKALSPSAAQEGKDVVSKGSKEGGDRSKNTDAGKEHATHPASPRLLSSPSTSSSFSTLTSSSSDRRKISPKCSTENKTDSEGVKKDLGGNRLENESKESSMDGSKALSPSVAQEGQDVASKGRKDDGDGSKNTESGTEPATFPAAARTSSAPSSSS